MLVAHTQRVREVVDGHAGQTQQAYVAEMARMQAEATSLRQGYLARLFGEASLSEEAVGQLAGDLGLPRDALYVAGAALDDQIGEVRLALANERAGYQVHNYSMGDALIVFFPLMRARARMARRQLASAGSPGLANIERTLHECGEAERHRLLDAVEACLETGSISQVASRLYCHRNTVRNRLKRFESLTGIDPTVPVQAARLVVGWA